MFSSKHHNKPAVLKFGSMKRPHHSNSKEISFKKPKTNHVAEEPRFTFEEVKEMLEKLTAMQTKTGVSCSSGLRRIDFEQIAVGDHSVESCKNLIEQLVQNTRRIRTLKEVLEDVKGNLKKRSYTQIIHRASFNGQLPKRPPSAYLMYLQERYPRIKTDNMLAVDVSRKVAEEWKNLSDKKKNEYMRRHDELLEEYEEEMRKLGLASTAAPKRPKSPKKLFIDLALENEQTDYWTKEDFSRKKEQLSAQFDELDPEMRQKWVDLFNEKCSLYEKERAEYIEAHPHLDHAGEDRKPRSAKAKPPEKPKTALKFFLQKKLSANLEGQELEAEKKRLKAKFANLKEKKLLKYVKKAVQDKERYESELQQFKRDNPDANIPRTNSNISKEHMKLYLKVVENRPTPPPQSSYLFFCGKLLGELENSDGNTSPGKRMRKASLSWQSSSAKEKIDTEKDYMADIERYIAEMEAWLDGRTEEQRAHLLATEPKIDPDYWRRKLQRTKKALGAK